MTGRERLIAAGGDVQKTAISKQHRCTMVTFWQKDSSLMMRRVGFLLIGILGLALILPWGAYWVGLYRISQYPLPPSQAISAPQREWVWSLAEVSGEPVIVPLSPYSYLYD